MASILMPPPIVPLSEMPPVMVLALVSVMPFGLIAPLLVLTIALVILELLMAIPVIATELVQPGLVTPLKLVGQAENAAGMPPPMKRAVSEDDASNWRSLARSTRRRWEAILQPRTAVPVHQLGASDFAELPSAHNLVFNFYKRLRRDKPEIHTVRERSRKLGLAIPRRLPHHHRAILK